MTNEAELLPYDAGVEEVAEFFNVSDRTVRRWVEKTDIPHARIRGTIRFRLAEVNAWARTTGRPHTEEDDEQG